MLLDPTSTRPSLLIHRLAPPPTLCHALPAVRVVHVRQRLLHPVQLAGYAVHGVVGVLTAKLQSALERETKEQQIGRKG